MIDHYIVESRLYVLDAPLARATSGRIGGISSHVWRQSGSSTWDIKVLLSAFFTYNGTTAICMPEESILRAVRADGTTISTNFNSEFFYKDGTTAKVGCDYSRDEPGSSSDTVIWGMIEVTCTKTGVVGIVSEVERRY